MNLPTSSEFIYAKCADKKTATELKPGTPPEIMIFDCDGELITRSGVTDVTSVENAMKAALEKYSNKEVSWETYRDGAVNPEVEKLMVLAFVDDKETSTKALKLFEDRTVAKHHGKIAFLKESYQKDSETATKWNVKTAPSFLIIDPNREEGKQVLDKLTGNVTLSQIRAALAKGFARMESGK